MWHGFRNLNSPEREPSVSSIVSVGKELGATTSAGTQSREAPAGSPIAQTASPATAAGTAARTQPAAVAWVQMDAAAAMRAIADRARSSGNAADLGTLHLARSSCNLLQAYAAQPDTRLKPEDYKHLTDAAITEQMLRAEATLRDACNQVNGADLPKYKGSAYSTSVVAQLFATAGPNPSRTLEEVTLQVLQNPGNDPAAFDHWLKVHFYATPLGQRSRLGHWSDTYFQDALYQRIVGKENVQSIRALERCALYAYCPEFSTMTPDQKRVADALVDKVEGAIRGQQWGTIFR